MVDEKLSLTIDRARRGDQEAFAELVSRYKGIIFRHAFGMLGDRQEAEDASQEIFIKAYLALSKLSDVHAFSSWLMRIATNLCKDKLKQRTKAIGTQDMLEETIPVDSAADSDLKISMQDALARLSVDQREILLLHDVQGYRYEEIAELTDIPIGTVKSRLFSARMSLRKIWNRGEGE
ncbi:RNA polymerase sigma factor [Paenibacillus riograndensis]|uniref:ECF subfamily RNA polymerase sigma-24 subunit n=1 Tax=Paenibacillus riograndensis SBR5 TaxID=1073571 RepID=A0A0E4CVX5_9BACL|nr:RNA polymerase sigma factor [Paenibacillus riograndensis]CQR54651.1 ECF subfamily RNA polymerase sigma-24 subunit [Paenibacillus riograndensis SBR5]